VSDPAPLQPIQHAPLHPALISTNQRGTVCAFTAQQWLELAYRPLYSTVGTNLHVWHQTSLWPFKVTHSGAIEVTALV
jgi:hypothetical protein